MITPESLVSQAPADLDPAAAAAPVDLGPAAAPAADLEPQAAVPPAPEMFVESTGPIEPTVPLMSEEEFNHVLKQVSDNTAAGPTKIAIKNCRFTVEQFNKFCEALSNNTRVLVLWMNNCDIDDAGAKCLAEAFRKNKKLYSVDLSRNNIGDEGIIALANSLASKDNLKKFFINHNFYIGRRGMTAFKDLHNNNLVVEGEMDTMAMSEDLEKEMQAIMANRKRTLSTTAHLLITILRGFHIMQESDDCEFQKSFLKSPIFEPNLIEEILSFIELRQRKINYLFGTPTEEEEEQKTKAEDANSCAALFAQARRVFARSTNQGSSLSTPMSSSSSSSTGSGSTLSTPMSSSSSSSTESGSSLSTPISSAASALPGAPLVFSSEGQQQGSASSTSAAANPKSEETSDKEDPNKGCGL